MQHRLFIICLAGLLSISLHAQTAQPSVDFKQVAVRISLDTITRYIEGQASYSLTAMKKTTSFFLDAHNTGIKELRLNGRRVQYENDGSRITIKKKLKPGRTYAIDLHYSVQPAQTVYFVGWEDEFGYNNQIWTQGQGKYTSHWLPSLDDMNDKMVFNLEIGFDSKYTVLANGKLVETREENGLKYWSYEMEHPMSSYLLAFAIGEYDSKSMLSASGIPIENYYYSGSDKRAEPTYRYTKDMFDFLEKEIGVPYPWSTYKQVPVQDFLYAGMENTGLTIYSDDYLTDSIAFRDKNYVEVNAHEMAHQWFGNLVTEKDGNHHWLHEGFATYYALLAEKEVLGEEVYYWKLYDKALALKKAADNGDGKALTDPGAGSLTFYDKGAWALVMLRELAGDTAFQSGVKQFLEHYAYGNATIADFLHEISTSSGMDLLDFRAKWLESTSFPQQEATNYLSRHSDVIQEYLSLQHEVRTSTLPNADILRKYWEQSESAELKRRSLSAYFRSLPIEFIREAFETGDTDIRQAIALSTTSVPPELKSEYESLLTDPSYRTQEQALYLLWVHFAEDRVKYLKQLKGIKGFSDRNVEQLWLLLAALTPDFETALDRERYRKQLSGYTDESNPFQVRQRAFVLLSEIQRMEDRNLQDLVRATIHPQYAFRSFARDLLDSYVSKPKEKERLRELIKELKPVERRYIEKKLTKE